jgi:hypothetical protein
MHICRNIAFICLLLATFSALPAQNSEDFFTDSPGKFRVKFPSQPEESFQLFESSWGTVRLIEWTSAPEEDPNLEYKVSYVDYPDSITGKLNTEETETFFNEAQAARMNSETNELLGVFNHQIIGYTGREYRWHFKNPEKLFRERFFLVNNRLYMLSVSTSLDQNFNLGINQFLNSFELINTAPGTNETEKSEVKLKFKVNFPKPTVLRDADGIGEFGPVKIRVEMCQVNMENDDNIAYLLTTAEYITDITQSEGFDLEQYFESQIENSLSGRQSTLVSKKRLNQSGMESMEWVETFRGDALLVHQRIFLVENQLYNVGVITIADKDNNKSMLQFLDSFSEKEN